MVSIGLLLTALILCSSAYTSEPSLPSHAEVIQQLWPYRDIYREFLFTRVIGLNQKPTPAHDNLECDACHLAINLAFSFVSQGTPEEVEEALIHICWELDLVAPDMCEGIFRGFTSHGYYILTETPSLRVDDVCGMVMQNLDCGVLNETMTNWEVTVDTNKPNPITRPPLPEGIPTTKILHITDIHPDLLYEVGSLGQCDKPMCCRRGEHWEEPWNSTVEAGYFGDYKCDIPLHAMQEAFHDAANRYEYKFVMLGGDYVHHAVWLTTKEEIIEHYKVVAESVLQNFPDTPVYPVIGNHESHPTNVFPPTSIWTNPLFDISWVYNTLADLYETKLTPEALVTFRAAGYYTMVPEPGLRVITLNSMFAYTMNFWLLYEPVDPEGQLQWFSDQMHRAEEAGEKVIILGHIPPGEADCWSVWNNHYSRIVDRYQNIILGAFYGHTHNDDFKIFFDGDRPSSLAWVSPSITAYTDINPGYKVFHFDGERQDSTWEIVDHEVFTYNLTLANDNVNQGPEWYRMYGAKESYGLTSIRPADIYDFVLRMAEDASLFQLFYLHYNKSSDTYEPCDDVDCVRGMLCALLTSNNNDTSRCSVLDGPLQRRFK